MWCCFFFFFKQKTAYEMRISDWSSDVCSSDLQRRARLLRGGIGLSEAGGGGGDVRRSLQPFLYQRVELRIAIGLPPSFRRPLGGIVGLQAAFRRDAGRPARDRLRTQVRHSRAGGDRKSTRLNSSH